MTPRVLVLGWPRPSSGCSATYCAKSYPVGLPTSRRVDLGRFLAGQHEEPRLDLGVVRARGWALGMVFEPLQAVLGEAMPPQEDGALGQPHVSGDGGIGLSAGDTQNDLGTIGVLLVEVRAAHGAPVRRAQ